LSDFSDEFSGLLFHDWGAMAQRIAPDDTNRPFDQDIHAWRDFSSYEQRFAGTVVPDCTEAAKTIDFMGRKPWEHLLAAAVDRRHVKLAVGDAS
jgi:hypothetical protein